ncbi:MAG: hypothetical protein ACKVT1_02880 [Dehalococcoidia bacterium]
MTALVSLVLAVALATAHWFNERHHRRPGQITVPIREHTRDGRG